MALQNNLPGR